MTASTATAAADDVTPYARKALIASTAGYAMDGFDFLILGFMLTAIRADLGLSQSEAASLATGRCLARSPAALASASSPTISGASGC